ncbi:DUF2071 domain-containing protein [Paenibacillus sp. LMG 31456]|uniref:DUF2071 domain-containing protein n=1 Tax=Paenibacillus foliorum TaxID=2654974 RepID=A0A972K200_9BACL|nr:DUF2071 domain-containing protein [Paenibacillus foliorum]NOU93337.1 DUF2071 domain-containing protein [Paenibacillus foliorum]
MMKQTWLDLLFAHWPIRYNQLRELVPPGLELDTYEGYAWISIVPFRMDSIRMRGLPPIPYTSSFEELNVRTYVTVGDKPGVYFFSLDAANRLAVMTARSFFYLPYFNANMKLEEREGVYDYVSHRKDKRGALVSYEGTYSPVSPAFYSKPGTIEHWLTERYCLYSVDKQNQVWRGEIHHLPWTLHAAEADFKINTMALGQGITVMDTKPLLHFSKQLEVLVWPISKVNNPE